jgi:hypothetical protein
MGRVDERHGDKGGNLDQILKIAEVFMCCVSIRIVRAQDRVHRCISIVPQRPSHSLPPPSPTHTLHVR